MKTRTKALTIAFVVTLASDGIAAKTIRDFNAPELRALRTLHDIIGLDAGLAQRLPGIGSARALHDPYLDLQTAQLAIHVDVHPKELCDECGTDVTFTENPRSGDLNTREAPEIVLGSESGLWTLSLNDLTALTSGSIYSVLQPWLNLESGFYVSVSTANAGAATSLLVTVDYCPPVTTVPEPTSQALTVAAVACFLYLRRKSKSKHAGIPLPR
jgi:hypothetical protein